MDVSGDNISGNEKYLAIVVGKEDHIRLLDKKIGPMRSHMADLTDKEQTTIIQNIQVRPQNVIALCITMKKKEIVDNFLTLRRIRLNRTPTAKIKRVYERILFKNIQHIIEKFCLDNSESIYNLIFECDRDCRPLAKTNSLKIEVPKIAHKICDVIAWCNNNNQSFDWVSDLNFTDKIPDSMRKLLRLN